MSNKNYIALRHLEDIDDLRYNMDAPLLDGQDSKVASLARIVQNEMNNQGCDNVIFLCSPKQRAIETSNLINSYISDNGGMKKSKIVTEKRIRELDQGRLILPEDYRPGDHFPALPNAWKTFFNETFEKGNLDYRFGESLNSEQYNSFGKHFKRFGESGRDLHVRIFSAISEFSDRRKDCNDYLPVIVSHGAVVAILKELEDVSRDILKGCPLKEGTLMQSCWEKFAQNENEKTYTDFGIFERLEASILRDPSIEAMRTREINYLKEGNGE